MFYIIRVGLGFLGDIVFMIVDNRISQKRNIKWYYLKYFLNLKESYYK